MKYTLNPFTKMRSKIEPPCKDFEKGVKAAISSYNDSVTGSSSASADDADSTKDGDATTAS